MLVFKIGDYVEVCGITPEVLIGERGYIKRLDLSTEDCLVTMADGERWIPPSHLQLVGENKSLQAGRFQEIANDIGAFTDGKNIQYGSSVDATYDMMKVLMERYSNEDDTYTIPKSLLPHLLLQVRMMDKINRIFNNPSGKGDSESPYKDLTGYSLIGVDMVERLKQDNQ